MAKPKLSSDELFEFSELASRESSRMNPENAPDGYQAINRLAMSHYVILSDKLRVLAIARR